MTENNVEVVEAVEVEVVEPVEKVSELDKKLNSALSNMKKRMEKQFEERLELKLKELHKPQEDKGSSADLNLMKLKMEEMEKKLIEADRKEKEAELKSKAHQKQLEITEALESLGVTGPKQKLAKKALSGDIDFDGDKLVFKSDKGVLPLKDGLKLYLESEDGSILVDVKSQQSQSNSVKKQLTDKDKSSFFRKFMNVD